MKKLIKHKSVKQNNTEIAEFYLKRLAKRIEDEKRYFKEMWKKPKTSSTRCNIEVNEKKGTEVHCSSCGE